MRPCWGFEVPLAGKRKREDEDFSTMGLTAEKDQPQATPSARSFNTGLARRKSQSPQAERFKVREKMFRFKHGNQTPWIYEDEEDEPWKLEDCPNQSEILKEARQTFDHIREYHEERENREAVATSPNDPNEEVAPFGATLQPRFRRHSKTVWLQPKERIGSIRRLKTKAFATFKGSVKDKLSPPPGRPGALKKAFWKLPHART